MRAFAVVCLFMFATAPAAAQHLGSRVQWQPETMTVDPRLEQPVGIEILGRAAVPALELLSEATGVSLTVAPENLDTVGERKLTIISKGLALKAIMVQLPEALQECHWDIDESREEPVYLLHRNAGAEVAAEQARSARRAQFMAQYEFEQAMQRSLRLDLARRALAMSSRELAVLEETDLLLALATQAPITREMMEIFLALPEETMTEFVDTGSLQFSYGEAPPEVKQLPQLALEALHEYVSWVESWPQGLQHPSGRTTEEMRGEIDGFAETLAQSSDATLELGSGYEGIYVRLGGVQFPFIPPQHDLGGYPGGFGHFLLGQTGRDNPREVARLEEWEQRLQQSEESDDFHAWEERLGVAPSDPRLLQSITLPGEADVIDLLDVERTVAEQTGISVVSDFFTSTNVYRYHLHDELPLWHLLGYLRMRRHEWKLLGDCLVFRETNWYRHGRSEVPERLLFPLVRKYCAGEFTLDDLCSLVLPIQDRGAAAFTVRGSVHPGLPQDLWRMALPSDGFWALHAYARLDEEHHLALRSDDGLAVADLPPTVRDIILSHAADPATPQRRPHEDFARATLRLQQTDPGSREDTSGDWSDSVFSLEFPNGSREEVRYRFPRTPIEITYTPLLCAEPETQSEEAP